MNDATSHLTRDDIEAIGQAFDEIREKEVADLGEEDARYIRRIVALARRSAIAGRALLMFGVTPLTWGAGVAALATGKILENMEVGHNVMHGQYDWMNDPTLDSRTYEWDNVCDAAHWRFYHNYEHHTFTNILDVDHDIGYSVFRMFPEQEWHPTYALQPLTNVFLAGLFQWGVARHRLSDEDVEGREEAVARSRAKAARQLFKDYVLFPMLATWNAPRVLAGNLTANGIRNVWTNIIIFCGHFPEGTRVYTREEVEHETRGDWYVRQIQGSANIAGGGWLHTMSGHLSHQIEHHLFPDLPAWRYPKIAPRVKAVCEEYGLPYNSGTLLEQYGSVLGRVFRYAFPPAAPVQPVAATS